MTAMTLLVMLALSILVAPLAAEAQPARKMPRIGVLAPDTPAGPWVDAFRQGLRDLGYVEGQTIALDIRWDEGKRERFTDFAAELVARQVDIIVAVPLGNERMACCQVGPSWRRMSSTACCNSGILLVTTSHTRS